MEKEIVVKGELISPAVKAGDFLFLSGTTGKNPEAGEFVEGGVAARTEYAFKKLSKVLEKAGSSLDKVVKVNVYLVDIENNFEEMDKAFRKIFPENPPARTTVGVAGLVSEEAKVEVELIATIM